jgi:peptide chain release factor 2
MKKINVLYTCIGDHLPFFMHEIKAQLEEIKKLVDHGLEKIDLGGKKKKLEVLEAEMQAPGFWNDKARATEVSQEASNLAKLIDVWKKMSMSVDELCELLPEIHPEDDPKAADEFREMVKKVAADWRTLEISTFLSGKYDENNAIVTIHAGTGGTDSQDFAEMLLRMYLRYAERTGFKTAFLEKSVGEEAGIKSCTFSVEGRFAYGYLKGEAGVHRLVRLSPFNSKNTRETSFVLLDIIPEIAHSQQVEIDPDDLRIDVYRSSGPGGQNVNKTDSAVRITHIPSGIVAACQSERSQLQNKERAMKLLHAKLADLMEKQQAKELSDLRGAVQEIAWGNQIRSYVLHPYKMVKDHRTGYEESNPDSVLDGKIEGFIEAELKKAGK